MICDTALRALEKEHKWTREFSAQVYPFYVATLAHLARGQPTTVFKVIDEMWHAHILCTRDYASFCERQFGKFVHHDKCEQSEAVTASRADAAFFQEYGLSVDQLEEIGRGLPEQPASILLVATCGQEDHEPPRLTGGRGQPASILRVASCGQEDYQTPPPPHAHEQPASILRVATCGQEDQPPRLTGGRGQSASILRVASCGQEDEFDTPPTRGREQPASVLRAAACGQDFEDPPPPPPPGERPISILRAAGCEREE